ncbi:tetratricopeptide repeat protein [Nonomuraea antimicrobica]
MGEAATAYAEGLALVDAPVWRALRVPLLTGRATLHLKLGQLDEAAARYREALALSEELGRSTDGTPGRRGDLAAAYADLALVHELRGEPAEARALAERALDLERAHARPHGTVLALIALARLESAASRSKVAGSRSESAASRSESVASRSESAGTRSESAGSHREGTGSRSESGARPEAGGSRTEGGGIGRAVTRLQEALALAQETGFRAGRRSR